MFGRRGAKTESQLMREELNQSLEHFRLAAAHAAGAGTSAVSPTMGAARKGVGTGVRKVGGAATAGLGLMAPAYAMAKSKARRGQKAKKRRGMMMTGGARGGRWGMVGGLAIAGAAAGAAGAVYARRRSAAKWDEYASPVEGGETSMMDSAREKASSITDTAAERTGGMAQTVQERSGEATSSAKSAMDRGANMTSQAAHSAADTGKSTADTLNQYAQETTDDVISRSQNRRP